MANIIEWNEAEYQVWLEWVNSRPEVVKELALKFPPNKLYKMRNTRYRVAIYGYCENGTVIVHATTEFNLILISRCFHDVKTDDLEECDLPSPKEVTGAVKIEVKVDGVIEERDFYLKSCGKNYKKVPVLKEGEKILETVMNEILIITPL